MSAKHEYVITLNAGDYHTKPVVYDYGRNKGLELYVSSKGVQIRFETRRLKEEKALVEYADKLLQDAIRKSLVLYALHTGCPMDIGVMLISVDNAQPVICMPSLEQNSPIYSMLREFLHPIHPIWDNHEIFTTLCRFTKTSEKNDSRVAALYSLLLSKTKHYEIERFIYMWMAVNGLYSYVAQQANLHMPLTQKGKQRQLKSEEDKIRFLALYTGMRYDCFIPSAKEKKLIREAEIRFSDMAVWTDESTRNTAVSEVANKVLEEELPMDEQAFLTLWLPYKLRCKYFHAEQPVPMICFRDEYLLRVIGKLNDVIETFIDTELPRWLGKEADRKRNGTVSLALSFVLKNEM